MPSVDQIVAMCDLAVRAVTMVHAQSLGRPELFVQTPADLGEGPVWDVRTDRFCWVDITAGMLHEVDQSGSTVESWATGTMLGAAAPRIAEPGFAFGRRGGVCRAG